MREHESSTFWSNMDYAMATNKQIKGLQTLFAKVQKLQSSISDLIAMIDLYHESDDDISILQDMYDEMIDLKEQVEDLRIKTLLNDKYDDSNAIITIHAGAGGTEAQDWVEMLYRMYNMYSTKNDYETVVLDSIAGNDAGLKSITFAIRGENAYGLLKGEMGVHRLVRISPFDSSNRRHTSFASVEVIPELVKGSDYKINSDDLHIDTYRSGGAGGQHVNKTESAIRITHIPTGIVVTCQNERSQLQNREMALKILTGKLIALEMEREQARLNELKGEKKNIEWGSQIRSYVFCPYTMVKDHRTDYETSDVQSVMNGDIQPFMNEYLKWLKTN